VVGLTQETDERGGEGAVILVHDRRRRPAAGEPEQADEQQEGERLEGGERQQQA